MSVQTVDVVSGVIMRKFKRNRWRFVLYGGACHKTLWLREASNGTTIKRNSASTGMVNWALRCRVSKLKQREEILVARTEHQIMPDRRRSVEKNERGIL